MNRRFRLGLLAVAISASFLSLGSSAVAAPCPSGTPAAFELAAPSTVAYGRTFRAQFSATSVEGWYSWGSAIGMNGVLLEPGTLSFGSISPEDRLGDRFTKIITKEFGESPLVAFEPGEGAGEFTASWTQARGQPESRFEPFEECQETKSIETRPIRGNLAHVRAAIVRELGDSVFQLSLSCPGQKESEGGFFDITRASITPISIQVRGAGANRKTTLSDICEFDYRQKLETRPWQAYLESRSRNERHLDEQVFTVEPNFSNKGAAPMHFRVTQGSKLLAAGRFKMEGRFRPSRKIWEGSDAFVNYCINETRTLRSHHGRLFCVYPGFLRYYAFGLKWSKGNS